LSTNELRGIYEKIRIRIYFCGWNVNLVWLIKKILSFLYEEILEEWKRGYMLEE
jgi:hypothetical protein